MWQNKFDIDLNCSLLLLRYARYQVIRNEYLIANSPAANSPSKMKTISIDSFIYRNAGEKSENYNVRLKAIVKVHLIASKHSTTRKWKFAIILKIKLRFAACVCVCVWQSDGQLKSYSIHWKCFWIFHFSPFAVNNYCSRLSSIAGALFIDLNSVICLLFAIDFFFLLFDSNYGPMCKQKKTMKTRGTENIHR